MVHYLNECREFREFRSYLVERRRLSDHLVFNQVVGQFITYCFLKNRGMDRK